MPSPPLVNPPSITVQIVTAHFQQNQNYSGMLPNALDLWPCGESSMDANTLFGCIRLVLGIGKRAMGAGAGARVHYLPGWCTPLRPVFIWTVHN